MANSEEIKWVVTADDKDIIAAFKRMNKELEATKQKMREQANETAKAGKAQDDLLAKGISGLAGMVAGWVSVQSAIQLATAEYDNYIERQQEAAKETLSTADAQLAFFRNLGNVSREQAKQIQETVRQIAGANKTTESRVYNVASIARSSQGALNDQQMFANVGMALRLAPDSEEQAVALAGALNASTRLTGSTDPRENAGLLLGIGEQTRIDNLAQISKTLLPAATGIKATLPSTSTEEAMALLSTLTTVSEDETGNVSRTAGMQLAAQLKEIKNGKKTIRTGTDLGDAIATLQNDEKKRKEFMDSASFEVQAKPFIEQLLTPGTPAAQLYSQNLAKVPTGQRAVNQANQFFENVGTSEYQGVATNARVFDSLASGLKLQDQGGASAAINMAGLDKAMQASRASWLERTMYANMFRYRTMVMGQDPNEFAAEALSDRAAELRIPFNRLTNEMLPEGTVKENEKLAVLLDKAVMELRGIRADNKSNTASKKNADAHTE